MASARWSTPPSNWPPSPAKIRMRACLTPPSSGAIPGDLQLYCPDVEKLETPFKIEQARAAEAAALAVDPRINNSEGGSFDSHLGRRVFANSRGFAGEYRTSYCSLSAVPVAREGDSMERDYWVSLARGFAGLEPAGTDRPHRRRASAAPLGRAQSGDTASAGDF